MFENIKKNLINIPGKRLPEKFLVLESDDWGTIRTPDKSAFDKLVSQKLLSEKDPFARYDTLESETDFQQLFEVLGRVKDHRGNYPVITANTVVANPDFQKIRESGFTQYHFEPFTETYKRYAPDSGAFACFRQGIDAGMMFPQFHAREHLNVALWMDLLKNGHPDFRAAFDLECFSIDYSNNANRRGNLMAAYDYYSGEGLDILKGSIEQGLDLFENLFGMKSKTTIAPCYVWDEKAEKIFQDRGVACLQGSKFQNIPSQDASGFKRKFHYNGEKNANGQIYLTRNGLFEPSINPRIDWVGKCMESIGIALSWKKPAVIGTHRLNFTGGIDGKNRENNLALLEKLLREVVKKWPDITFIHSAQLADYYAVQHLKQ